jgi:hypothetical protein
MNDAVLAKLVDQITERLLQCGCPSRTAERTEQALKSHLVTALKAATIVDEAFSLLPFGADSAALQLGVHRATVYRRASRRKKAERNATLP